MDDILSVLLKVIQNSEATKLNLKPLSTFIMESLPKAASELKEINTLLTEISKTDNSLSKSDLAAMTEHSFDIAVKYGKTAADYLTGVQNALNSGYRNAEEIGELALSLQTAGNMTAELANRVITATDKAYKMNGSVTELTKALDGMNNISNHNLVNMAELSEGMSIIGSTAASMGVELNETTAALGTLLTKTGQGGSETAGAFEAILLNILQLSEAEDELRTPMEILRDLSAEYNSFKDTDLRKMDLLNSVGGSTYASQADALLRNWDTYEEMLQQYETGAGSMAAEVEKAAQSWESSLNRLHNTWVDTIGNAADSDAVITLINSLNGLLSIVNRITEAIDAWSPVVFGAGLLSGMKNVGRDKMLSLKYCYLF